MPRGREVVTRAKPEAARTGVLAPDRDRPQGDARAPAGADAVTRGPWLLLAALAAVVLAVAPWVNAPLNDDWQYARAAKHLADTGALTIDTPIAPSIVLQTVLGAAVVKMLGFSHVTLRLLTVLLAGLGLVCIERTLRAVGAARLPSLFACLLCLANPIVLHVTTTYLSEWYGYVFALAAVAVWFRVRGRLDDRAALPAWVYGVAAGCAVAGFWSRQLAVLVYPALCVSRVPGWLARTRRPAPTELIAAAVGAVAVAAGVAGYFAWARATGNLKPELLTPLGAMTRFAPRMWLLEGAACLAYLSASFAPLLLLARTRPRGLLLAAACAVFMAVGVMALRAAGQHGFAPVKPLNAHFPYVNNVVYRTGVGPLTVSDVYAGSDVAHPDWGEGAWGLIEGATWVSVLLWGALWRPSGAPSARGGARAELAWFAAAFAVATQAVNIQAYPGNVFDRYYFPCVLALTLFVPAVLPVDLRPGWRWAPAVLAAVGLAWFSVAGTHDYFRWNQARLDLYQQARSAGASPSSIDGGYELNGWYLTGQSYPQTCIGPCSCHAWSWFCTDNSYRVLMGGVPPGYTDVAVVKPTYWLARGPGLRLVVRK
jgi:hypothetical protein